MVIVKVFIFNGQILKSQSTSVGFEHACAQNYLRKQILYQQYNFARILTRHATISRFSGARTKIFGGTPPKSPRMRACVRVCGVRAASQCARGRAGAHSPLRGSCEPLRVRVRVLFDDGRRTDARGSENNYPRYCTQEHIQ